MLGENFVRELEFADGTTKYRASYFIESGVLHASIGHKVISLSIGVDKSEEAVRRLLAGHTQTKAWRTRMAESWRVILGGNGHNSPPDKHGKPDSVRRTRR